jgi:hypothetical protein
MERGDREIIPIHPPPLPRMERRDREIILYTSASVAEDGEV